MSQFSPEAQTIQLSQRIAEKFVKQIEVQKNNLFFLLKSKRIKLTQARANRIIQISASIQNLGQTITAKIQGGQMFLPKNKNCQCLAVDGDQQFILTPGQNKIKIKSLCSQKNKAPPDGCNYQITDKVLEAYLNGATQSQLWERQTLAQKQALTQEKLQESLQKIEKAFTKILNSFHPISSSGGR